jgi:pyridoxal biosynthesis lyase PdxS
MTEAKLLGAPYDLVCWVAENGKLPVPNFAAGGIATPPTRRCAWPSAPRRCSSAAASS